MAIINSCTTKLMKFEKSFKHENFLFLETFSLKTFETQNTSKISQKPSSNNLVTFIGPNMKKVHIWRLSYVHFQCTFLLPHSSLIFSHFVPRTEPLKDSFYINSSRELCKSAGKPRLLYNKQNVLRH